MAHDEHDIIVVGGGGSGLAAAVSAAEHGAHVVVLEKQPRCGGTTRIAVGSLTACQTSMQKAAGIDDTVEAHADDASRFAAPDIEERNCDELRRFFLSHTADTLDWLTGMGLRFHGPSPEPPNRVPRMHNVVPAARAYIDTLSDRLKKLGGTIITNADVRKLIQTQTGICHVEVDVLGTLKTIYASRGVILAAGDYAANAELIAKHKGPQFGNVDGINPHANGDGHRLAESVGAALVNMDITYGPELRFVAPKRDTILDRLPTRGPIAWCVNLATGFTPRFINDAVAKRLLVTWQHPENSLFVDGAILVNQNGQRFCRETRTPERELAIAEQPGKAAFIVLDERLIEQYSQWPHFVSTAPQIAYAYVKDYLRLRPDIAISGNTLRALAVRRGLNSQALQDTVDEWNANAANDDHARLEGRRWALLGPVKSWFTTTEGGCAINQRFEVLDVDGNPIPRLYAVGQNGLGGQILWGHGLHIAWAITSGRLAGQLIARA